MNKLMSRMTLFAAMTVMNGLVVMAMSVVLLCVGGRAFAAETVSAEAKRYFTRGLAAVEMARSPVDYDLAIEEFTKARSLAPDWPDVHYNLGVVQEKAGKFGEAAASLKRYLQLAPGAANAESVTDLMTRLEFKAEQVITDDDALNIFASLGDSSTWQLKGATPKDPPDPANFRNMQVSRRDGRQIFITYWSGVDRLSQQIITKTKPVTPHGKTLSFTNIYYLCPQSVQRDECPELTSYSLEIINKRKVEMHVKCTAPKIHNVGGWINNSSYEFIKK